MRSMTKWFAGAAMVLMLAGGALADDAAKPGLSADGTEPAGLYSAAQLMNAPVYAKDGTTELGGIDDIMFDNDMTIQAFVIETRTEMGLTGKAYVVLPDEMSVATKEGTQETKPEYRVTLNMDAAGLAKKPIYSESWWNTARTQASSAWQKTQKAAGSAWTSFKRGTHQLLEKAADATDTDGEDTAQ